MTSQELINYSLKLIGVLASGESPSSDESTDSLVCLNGMIENWNLQKLLVYSRVNMQYVLTGSQQSYTFGPSGNINTTGAISALTLNAGGTGYSATNVLTIVQSGASGGTVYVDTVTGGVVTTWHLLTAGTLYYPATALTTTGGGGSGAKFNITQVNYGRPLKIESAGAIIGGLRHPLTIATPKQWIEVRERAATAVLPLLLYNDNAFPLATLSLWPIPSGTPTLDLLMWQQLETLPLLSTVISLPPGYFEAVAYNLAVRLATLFKVPADPVVAAIAADTKQALAALNAANEAAVDAVPTPPPAQ